MSISPENDAETCFQDGIVLSEIIMWPPYFPVLRTDLWLKNAA